RMAAAKRAGPPRGAEDAKSVIEIALEKGLDEEFVARDVANAEPIAGVIVTTPDGYTGMTDAQGVITVRAATWPRSIKFEHEGFAPVELMPNDGLHATGEVLMRPRTR